MAEISTGLPYDNVVNDENSQMLERRSSERRLREAESHRENQYTHNGYHYNNYGVSNNYPPQPNYFGYDSFVGQADENINNTILSSATGHPHHDGSSLQDNNYNIQNERNYAVTHIDVDFSQETDEGIRNRMNKLKVRLSRKHIIRVPII